MRHLALLCPRCDHEAQVWISDLGQTLRCKKCKSPFHVNSGGKCIRGLRPDQDEPDPYALVREQTPPQFDTWSRMPMPVRWAVLVACVVVIGVLLAMAIRPNPNVLPESLLDRTKFVANAVLNNDKEALLSISDPGTSLSATRWLELKRPASWAVWDHAERAEISASVLFQSNANNAASTVATLTFPSITTEKPQAIKRGRPAGPRVELVMFWNRDSSGLWRIDGARTVKESTRR